MTYSLARLPAVPITGEKTRGRDQTHLSKFRGDADA